MSDAPGERGRGGTEPASIWRRPERGSRGPSPAHSRDALVDAAVALADAGGLGAVSMRAVAAALGTSGGSLYRYVSSRDDLLDLMVDRVVGELRPYRRDATETWLDAMLTLARRQLALYRRHPWLVELVQRPGAGGPESLAWFDHCLQVLEPVECEIRAKFEAIAMMTGVITLVARSETAPRPDPFAGVDLTVYPHLAAALTRPAAAPPSQDLFERALRALLTGLLAVSGDREPPV